MTQRRRDERGAAAVEFALVMPILFLIVFAIISFGFLFAQDLALSNAARQTARFSVVETRTCGDIKAEALDAAEPLVTVVNDNTHIVVQKGIAGGGRSAVCAGADDDRPCADTPDRTNIYVTLNYTAPVLIPVVPGMGPTMDLDGEGVFRCEFS